MSFSYFKKIWEVKVNFKKIKLYFPINFPLISSTKIKENHIIGVFTRVNILSKMNLLVVTKRRLNI
jgi:hypothetical protein